MSEKQILPISVGNNCVIYAEVMMLGGEEDVSSRLLSIDDSMKAIEGIATKLSKVFEAVKPDKAVAEFNVTLTAESGKLTALLVSGGASTSIKISLQWGTSKQETVSSGD